MKYKITLVLETFDLDKNGVSDLVLETIKNQLSEDEAILSIKVKRDLNDEDIDLDDEEDEIVYDDEDEIYDEL